MKTPTLPQPLKGPAILVSHAGRGVPGPRPRGRRPEPPAGRSWSATRTSKTASRRRRSPRRPTCRSRASGSNLPIGSHSALAAFGNLCAKQLVMPTTMTAPERQVVQTEHDHQRRRLSGSDHRPQGRRQHRVRDRAACRRQAASACSGAYLKQDAQESQESAPEAHAEGAADERRTRQKAADGQPRGSASRRRRARARRPTRRSTSTRRARGAGLGLAPPPPVGARAPA